MFGLFKFWARSTRLAAPPSEQAGAILEIGHNGGPSFNDDPILWDDRRGDLLSAIEPFRQFAEMVLADPDLLGVGHLTIQSQSGNRVALSRADFLVLFAACEKEASYETEA